MKLLVLVLSLLISSGKVFAVTVPEAAVTIVKQFEGLRLTAYRDPVGLLSIGYGHYNSTPPPCTDCMVITEAQADSMLENDLEHILSLIQGHIAVDLTENQLAALLSFAFNLGQNSLINSTLLKEVNSGNFTGAAEEFTLWVHAGGQVLPGLVARRNAEKELFLTPDGEVTIASN
jgi:lysozyme